MKPLEFPVLQRHGLAYGGQQRSLVRQFRRHAGQSPGYLQSKDRNPLYGAFRGDAVDCGADLNFGESFSISALPRFARTGDFTVLAGMVVALRK